MLVPAVSRGNIYKWHAVSSHRNILPTFAKAICGAPVINPTTSLHSFGDQPNSCKSCVKMAQGRGEL